MRIYTSASNPLDFCKRCAPKSEESAFRRYGNLGNGPDGRGNCFGYDDDHPPYDDDDYRCTTCGRMLTDAD